MEKAQISIPRVGIERTTLSAGGAAVLQKDQPPAKVMEALKKLGGLSSSEPPRTQEVAGSIPTRGTEIRAFFILP